MYRSGFIALIGLPNAGKSTLLNLIVGEKVAIVTPKPQTTRRRVSGIVNVPGAQFIYVDAPGVLDVPSSDLNKFLIAEYQDVLANADGAFAIIAAPDALNERSQGIVDLLSRGRRPFAILVTKADLLTPDEAQTIQEKYSTKNVIFISATTQPEAAREGVLKLSELLVPEGTALYDAELFTTENLRDLSAETIREKCFLNLHQEIPFGLAVKITAFNEDPKLTRIEADIVVEREAHKKIVIGEKATQLKKIGMEARHELEKLLGTKIFLGLHVVCKPRWMQDQALMRELGYVQRD